MKIIKFYSDTCGPCKVLDSNLKKASINYESINANNDENNASIAAVISIIIYDILLFSTK